MTDWPSGSIYDDDYKPGVYGKSRGTDVPACHMSHPPLAVNGGTLLGGNCSTHSHHKDVDLYVALDGSMKHPYFDPEKPAPRCVYYPITNMRVPNNPDKFRALVTFILDELSQGHTVHVGCIGGHGRTGLVLAAVIAEAGITTDAITYVRKAYCSRAVETAGQEGFLVTHFGVDPIAPSPSLKSVDKYGEGF